MVVGDFGGDGIAEDVARRDRPVGPSDVERRGGLVFAGEGVAAFPDDVGEAAVAAVELEEIDRRDVREARFGSPADAGEGAGGPFEGVGDGEAFGDLAVFVG